MEVGLLHRTLREEAMTRIEPCPTCKGEGEVIRFVPFGEGTLSGNTRYIRFADDCEECGGTGLANDSDAEVIPHRRSDTERE